MKSWKIKNNHFLKVLVVAMAIILFFFFIGKMFFAQNIAEMSHMFIGKYSSLDTGNGQFILKNGSALINTDVTDYKFNNNFLIAARQPIEYYKEGDVTLDRRLEICELWVINLETDVITKNDELEGLGCHLGLFDLKEFKGNE